MVEGPGRAGPRSGYRRISGTPYELPREREDPRTLAHLANRCLERARDELDRGDYNEAAVSFSMGARKLLSIAGNCAWDGAIEWIERSIAPRERAIELFHRVGRTLDEARDISFLGKAYSRLGVLRQDKKALMRSVVERSVALELFREQGRIDLQAEELSYLADDFRALGRQNEEYQLRRHFYLLAHHYSEAALKLYSRYLRGSYLVERMRHEEGFSARALYFAALLTTDLAQLADICAARDKNLELAIRWKKSGLLSWAIKALAMAVKVQKNLALNLLTNQQEVRYALELTGQLQSWVVEEGNEEGVANLDNKIRELEEILRALTVPVSA